VLVLTPVILAIQKAEARRTAFRIQLRQIVLGRSYLEKTHHREKLAEWLKVVRVPA
jgi:hypothetical protein